MRFQEIKESSTTAGTISTVAKPIGETQKRTQITGLQPASTVMAGKAKKKGPYANSLSEGKKQVEEAELSEDDIILVPGQGRMRKSGFVKNDPDRVEHEGQTLKNSLHTIIRLATGLDKELSVRDSFPEWVSEKVGSVKGDMLAVMNYILSAKEMQHDTDAMDENKIDFAKKLQKNIDKSNMAVVKTKKEIGSRIADIGPGGKEHNVKTDKAWDDAHKVKEGAKVDRMVKHVAQSEKKLGHGKKEAENIAWATANKRGMLNNKNKKA